jgi:lysophospholipase L1-like esterase
MTWKQFTPAVGSYLDRHPSPGMILIQVGSNDLGSTKGFELVHDIECDLLRLRVLLPDVKIVWSELLHTAREGKAMEKTRKRVNLAVKNIVLGVGGYVIKHNNIRARDINLFRNDGTHLSDIGINVYLNTIQGALESFLSSNGPRVFPLQ